MMRWTPGKPPSNQGGSRKGGEQDGVPILEKKIALAKGACGPSKSVITHFVTHRGPNS